MLKVRKALSKNRDANVKEKIIVRKVCLSIISMFFCLVASCCTSLALDDNENLFEKFITMCYKNENDVRVFDDEVNISQKFLNENRNSFDEKNYQMIKDNIESNRYVIYIEETSKARANNVVSKTFKKYESGYDQDKKYKKEWLTELYCKFTYNSNTGSIATIYDPSLTIDYGSWGSLFSPYSVNISTSYSKKSRLTVSFSYSYGTKCTFMSSGGTPIQTLNYGTKSGSFSLRA